MHDASKGPADIAGAGPHFPTLRKGAASGPFSPASGRKKKGDGAFSIFSLSLGREGAHSPPLAANGK